MHNFPLECETATHRPTGANPLEDLRFDAPFYGLGPDFHDVVQPGSFNGLRLRWRNPDLLEGLGVDLGRLSDRHLLEAFGVFRPLSNRRHPPLAQRYIGYQFRAFNPHLGDGRGFLLAQVRTPYGRLIDLGTKGSGTTPYSRGGDGMLTLKGGVREIIAAEFLHAMGVKTSRAVTVIEHDARLYRGDEPSPTRSSILVRAGEGHVRFGSFERVFYLVRDPAQQRAMMAALADHVVELYYPELLEAPAGPDRYVALFGRVVERCAPLVAGWVKAGFCHGVLNTDNMSLTGDSFDYGPYAFMEEYDPEFTAAYFDTTGLYAFEAQADAVYWNLAMLARPFAVLAPAERLQLELERFPELYREALRQALLPRLGFVDRGSQACKLLLLVTLDLLRLTGVDYHGFFRELTGRVGTVGLEAGGPRLPERLWRSEAPEVSEVVRAWRSAWQSRLELEPDRPERRDEVVGRLEASNPRHVPHRPEIERVWAAIDKEDDWRPFYAWVEKLRAPFGG